MGLMVARTLWTNESLGSIEPTGLLIQSVLQYGFIGESIMDNKTNLTLDDVVAIIQTFPVTNIGSNGELMIDKIALLERINAGDRPIPFAYFDIGN